MTKPALILGIAAAFVMSALPLAASAGADHSGYRPAQWQRSHDGQGVLRVYNADAYRAPEAYTGGEFRGGLDVQTATSYADYEARYAETSDRYGPPPPAPCRSVCVTAEAPPPPPPCAAHHRREVRYVEPQVVSSRRVVIAEEEAYEEHSEYYRESAHNGDYHRAHARHDDCPCRQGHDRHDAGYDDRYDDQYDRRDDRYGGYRGDVFGRY